MNLCHNEAEKFQMDIDQHISPTEKAGAMRLIGLCVHFTLPTTVSTVTLTSNLPPVTCTSNCSAIMGVI